MVFQITNLLGMHLATPDPCNTPPSMAPVPYPNIAYTTTSIPTATHVFSCCGIALTMAVKAVTSIGDSAGAGMGIMSGLIMVPASYVTGCFTVLISGQPAVNTGKLTMQNSTNCYGTAGLLPSQARVFILG